MDSLFLAKLGIQIEAIIKEAWNKQWNRVYYKGGFKNNKKKGKGELFLTNNIICSYKGEFVDEKFEGHGEIIYSNGDKYSG